MCTPGCTEPYGYGAQLSPRDQSAQEYLRQGTHVLTPAMLHTRAMDDQSLQAEFYVSAATVAQPPTFSRLIWNEQRLAGKDVHAHTDAATHTDRCSAHARKLFYFLFVGGRWRDASIFFSFCIQKTHRKFLCLLGRRMHVQDHTHTLIQQWLSVRGCDFTCLILFPHCLVVMQKVTFGLPHFFTFSCLHCSVSIGRKLPWTLWTLRSTITQGWWERIATKQFYPVSRAATQASDISYYKHNIEVAICKTIFMLIILNIFASSFTLMLKCVRKTSNFQYFCSQWHT